MSHLEKENHALVDCAHKLEQLKERALELQLTTEFFARRDTFRPQLHVPHRRRPRIERQFTALNAQQLKADKSKFIYRGQEAPSGGDRSCLQLARASNSTQDSFMRHPKEKRRQVHRRLSPTVNFLFF
jgi:hypothetical protein